MTSRTASRTKLFFEGNDLHVALSNSQPSRLGNWGPNPRSSYASL